MNPRHFLTTLALLLGAMLLGSSPVYADGAPVGNDVQVAQSLGERELTVVIRRMDAVPGPVRIEIVTHAGSPAGRLDLRLAAAGSGTPPEGLPPAGTVTSSAAVSLGAEPGLYGQTLRVDRPGPWALEVDDGLRVARIPFVVPVKVITRWEAATYGGFTAAGVSLLAALVLAVRARRTWTVMIPAGGLLMAVAVAVTAAILSSSIPPLPAPGSRVDPTIDNVTDPYGAAAVPAADYSRPPASLHVRTPGAPVAGRAAEVRLALADGSTGRPVDDLLVHHNAFVHLVIIGPSGGLWHLHPVLVAPGEYEARFTPPEGGTYALAAEVARRGGGVQMLRLPTGLQVRGPGSPESSPEPAGPGARVVGGVKVNVAVGGLGGATTVSARIGDRPDLQPWLGMLGHMIIVGPLPKGSREVGAGATTAPTWAHTHAMAPVSNTLENPPDETVAAFGPDVRFTHTFTSPGRYRLWIQVQRGYSVLTIPIALDIPGQEGRRS
ncbi:hypothetical protein [Nonomuraea sp. NPDC046570]|uniref:hypothetical protein n=1 Tax=Nonomuraea sp. NPDC046570 TaxID=3155255 RepID=UPI0033CD8203